jgi:hypothetical protein
MELKCAICGSSEVRHKWSLPGRECIICWNKDCVDFGLEKIIFTEEGK